MGPYRRLPVVLSCGLGGLSAVGVYYAAAYVAVHCGTFASTAAVVGGCLSVGAAGTITFGLSRRFALLRWFAIAGIALAVCGLPAAFIGESVQRTYAERAREKGAALVSWLASFRASRGEYPSSLRDLQEWNADWADLGFGRSLGYDAPLPPTRFRVWFISGPALGSAGSWEVTYYHSQTGRWEVGREH